MRSLRISIFLTMIILIGLGLVMIYSASSVTMWQKTGESAAFLKKQAVYVFAGFLLMFLVMSVDYHYLCRWSKPLLILFGLPLLFLVIPGISREVGGARRWLHILGFNFQPSEFIKFALIIYMADFLTRKAQWVRDFWRGFIPPVAILGFFTLLILLQPDLGTAISLVVVVYGMLFVAGARPQYLFGSILAALPLLYALVFSVPYRRARIMAFLNPWLDPKGGGFQIIQSQIALGSGGLMGLGLGQGKQKLFYLPAAHTDFIFSIIAEELGLVGASIVVLLFLFLIIRMTQVILRLTDPFGRLICMGIMILVAFSAAVNIGVSIGALPTKGLPLPFVSYGGSSLIFHMMAMGLFLNVSKNQEVAL